MRKALGIALSLPLMSCGLFDGPSVDKNAYDDEGRERIPILTATSSVSADPALASYRVSIPKPYTNKNWAQSGGNGVHVPQHLSLGKSLSLAWRTDVGPGNQPYERVITGPVAADGKIFAVDVKGGVSAVSVATGNVVWLNPMDHEGEQSAVAFGGGVAYRDTKLYVSSGYGEVNALDANTGVRLWTYDNIVPMRGAPTVGGDFVFVVTQDNQVIALDADTGEELWVNVGIAENAGVLGAASPAFNGETVVAGLSSGELIGMLAANGRILWQDSVSSGRRLTPLSTLTDIDGNPVIFENRAIAVSHAGRMIALDMRSGERAWESDIAGVHTPWIAGDFGYVMTVDSQLVCFAARDGRIRWVAQLQRFEDQERRRGLITWQGPVLAGDRLIITSSHGFAVSVSPYSGEVLSGVQLPAGTTVDPIVVDNTLVVLTEKGELVAYR